MVRITLKLVNEARALDKLLPSLLRANRSIGAARQELKWIKAELPPDKWNEAVKRRLRLEPLQYILGSQPFGSLDIKCKQNVLIPRWETEEWCFALINAIKSSKLSKINIIDACCGTGCIPLALDKELLNKTILAFDISDDAINLAKENNQLNNLNVKITRGDVFDKNLSTTLSFYPDLITSNPPYIPKNDYFSSFKNNGVEKSVKLYEPVLALIGDLEFYHGLITNLLIPSNANGFIFELGYVQQADFVFNLLSSDWVVGKLYDSNQKLRCVLGWKKNSNMELLKELCHEIYE